MTHIHSELNLKKDHRHGVIGHRGGLRQRVVAGNKEPTARSPMPGEPPRHGDGLPARPGSRCPIRRRGVQEGDFEGLHTRLDSRSNLLKSRPGLPTPRTRGPRRIRSGVRGRRGPDVFRTVSLSTGGGKQQGTGPCEGLGRSEQVEIRLLGLTIDKRLTFTPHVAKACKKTANIYKGIARAAKATWGLSPEIVRTIYVVVIEPIVITVSLHSALILARLLPLDIRVREAARLYEVKRGRELGDVCADRELERPVDFCNLLHPAHTPEFGLEIVEDLDPLTMDRLAFVGPHIYTDGNKVEGKVGAALIEWRDGMESGNYAYRLESFCTVFQAEMFALNRAIRRDKKGRIGWSTSSATQSRHYRC
ncbi:hypothetical protein EVAR_85122_1 [Eumeta japonica]|uniref:115 kDa protein in type-1 retrotransposable element R1DM n=1 Tax=Eumeta variegata TaxID=151549 RepID=A0A4C1XTH7_EUMVA|nr:hypothetical protein EVAR_85122_1 [Eumeta japonica]